MGATVDISVAGLTLGGATVLGGVLGGAAGAAAAGGRKVRRRLRGQDELQVREEVLKLLAYYAIATIRAMLARGHAAAAVKPDWIEEAVKEHLAADADPVWRAPLNKARGRADWSDLSRPSPSGAFGLAARATTVNEVAAALEDWLVRTNAGA